MHVIGIVGRAYFNREDQDIFQTRDELRRYLNNREDVVCLTLLPTEKAVLTNLEPGEDKVDTKIDYLLDMCDAFVVPGGTYAYNFDEYVINYAIRNDKPLLAICLGFQVLCSMFADNRTKFDMSVRKDLETHLGPPTQYKHEVNILKNTKLYNILLDERIPVNSVHHDVIDFEMHDLVINAKSDDGIIEGVEYPDKSFIVGVQWHPEYIVDDNSKKILDSFIDNINK